MLFSFLSIEVLSFSLIRGWRIAAPSCATARNDRAEKRFRGNAIYMKTKMFVAGDLRHKKSTCMPAGAEMCRFPRVHNFGIYRYEIQYKSNEFIFQEGKEK
jgi:hypothetical protein